MHNLGYAGRVVGLAALLAACGSDPGLLTSTGTGTRTLHVEGQIEWDASDQAAAIRVVVERAGLVVDAATVTVRSPLGDVILVRGRDDDAAAYLGVQPGWATHYTLEVVDGDDRLNASIAAPELMTLLAPSAGIDARALPGGMLTVRWSGEPADSIRVKSAGFEHRGVDLGQVDMAATMLEDEEQELELRRDNSIQLAGGMPGSSLTATCEAEFTLLVSDPF